MTCRKLYNHIHIIPDISEIEKSHLEFFPVPSTIEDMETGQEKKLIWYEKNYFGTKKDYFSVICRDLLIYIAFFQLIKNEKLATQERTSVDIRLTELENLHKLATAREFERLSYNMLGTLPRIWRYFNLSYSEFMTIKKRTNKERALIIANKKKEKTILDMKYVYEHKKQWLEKGKTDKYIHQKLRDWWDNKYSKNEDRKDALRAKFNKWHEKGAETNGTFK